MPILALPSKNNTFENDTSKLNLMLNKLYKSFWIRK